jgi:hypothetical protein
LKYCCELHFPVALRLTIDVGGRTTQAPVAATTGQPERISSMAKKTSKWFAAGSGCFTRYDDVLLFQWNGRADGSARYLPHVKHYSRNGLEFTSLAALLRWVEAEPRV